MKKYIAIVVSLFASFVVISVSAYGAYSFVVMGQTQAQADSRGVLNGLYIEDNSESTTTPDVQPSTADTLNDINILLLGIDDEANLPDVIMVIVYDGQNNAIDIIQMPRDTQVIMTTEERNIITDAGRWHPAHGVVKLNELHAHGGNAVGHVAVSNFVERTLGIEIDYYIILDLDAFRHIVDAVGGIYMDIPPEGFRYTVTGGTIQINIPGGRQMLDGDAAEQVVRFRGYRDGDLGRIRTQQQFMTEFFTQVLSREHIIGNMPILIHSFMRYVRTDFGILEALRYAGAAEALNPDSIEFHTLPGQAGFAPNPVGQNLSWFFVDQAAAWEMVYDIKAAN